MKRTTALSIVLAVVLGACGPGEGDEGGSRTYKAIFSRAIQLFPGGTVRVLGVDVGLVRDIRNIDEGVEVTFSVDDPRIKLPADVNAVIVPASLLGERYVQLLPAYEGGPTLADDATIPTSRTAVPAEPDELLASLQDYLGALDPEVVSDFVGNAADVLRGTGEELNGLIRNAAGVLSTLAAKRDDLAEIVVQFERLTTALATRQDALGRVIRRYNAVAGTIVSNRSALEGTISGLNDMATELAALLLSHRTPLASDIRSLTRTSRTLDRNVGRLTRTGHWAERLFRAASRAVDYEKDWLRLNNQGEPLEALIVKRLRQRLVEFCADAGLPSCALPTYWSRNAPSMFCFAVRCPPQERGDPVEQVADAISRAPTLVEELLARARRLACADAPNPSACRQRRRAIVSCLRADHPRACLERREVRRVCRAADDPRACLERRRQRDLEDLVKGLLDDTVGDPAGLGVLP